MGRRKKRPRNTSVSPQTRQTDIAPADAAPDPVDPPRPNRPLLAVSIVCFLSWLGLLLYFTLGRLMP